MAQEKHSRKYSLKLVSKNSILRRLQDRRESPATIVIFFLCCLAVLYASTIFINFFITAIVRVVEQL